MKGFLSDGISLEDFEKMVLGCLTIIITVVILYVYIRYKYLDSNIITLDLGIASLFVIRKTMKYWLGDATDENNSSLNEIKSIVNDLKDTVNNASTSTTAQDGTSIDVTGASTQTTESNNQ